MGGSLALRLVLGIGLASVLAYLATPVAIVAAKRFAFYDRPAGYKGHTAPTPYLGGAAVMAAFAVAALLGAGDLGRTLPLLGGVGVLWVLGTIDDRRTVSPLVRVLVEFALAVWLSVLGHGWHLGAGAPLDALVTGLWVVGVINAFNLFDNMDGAASTMALVVAAGACALGWLHDNAWSVAASAALCGACLGFLPHNLSRPARIFLGDGGSIPLGFAIAVLVSSSARGAEPSLLALSTGLLLIALPALDTTLVIISRRRRGVSILTGGQDHLTHRTRARVRTARRVALVLGASQALISALVIVATRSGAMTIGYLLMALVVAAGVTILALERAVEPGPVAPGSGARAGAAGETGAMRRAPWFARVPALALIVIGLGSGASAFFAAYYDSSVWIPIGFVVVIVAAVGCVIRPPRVTLPMLLIGAGATALGLLSLLSSTWAASAESATTQANRWLAYGALLLLIFLLVRRSRDARLLLAAAGVGIAAVAITVVGRMLGSAPWDLFAGGRLDLPLGYVNGEACVFAAGLWFAIALAERRESWIAGPGVAAAVVLAGLTLLSQARGAAIASFAAVLVALLAFPGRRRRVFALAIIGVGLLGAGRPLLDVYRHAHGGAVATSDAHHAAWALLAAAAAAGVVWTALVAFTRALYDRSPRRQVGLGRTAATLAAIVVLVPVLAVAVKAPSIEHTLRTQWHAFVHVSERPSTAAASASQTRLLTGAGNRYDYWRIAWKVFKAHPFAGVGAGNYTASYYRYRRTQEAIENPHSIEMQTLSELGILGGLLLAVMLAGVAIGARRLCRRARGSQAARTLLVAAGGSFVVWLVDTSGDWMHLLPGVTAVALAGMAVFAAQPAEVAEVSGVAVGGRTGGVGGLGEPGQTAGRGRLAAGRGRLAAVRGRLAAVRGRLAAVRGRPAAWRPGALLGVAVVALVLTVAGGNLLRQGLAQRYLRHAKRELSAHPGAAINDAVRALRLDGSNLDAYYVKAAGEARFDQAAAAEQTLMDAAREDPQDFVTWVLLGDLQVRRRNFSAARSFYGRAHALDPNDPSIAKLAADPSVALATP